MWAVSYFHQVFLRCVLPDEISVVYFAHCYVCVLYFCWEVPPHAAVSHVAHHPLLPPGASHRSSLPPSSHVRYPSRACSGFLLCLKLLRSNYSQCSGLEEHLVKLIKSGLEAHTNILQNLSGCIFHEKSWNMLSPHVLRAIDPSTITRHSLIMLSSSAELDPFKETLPSWPGCLRYIKLWN